MQDLLAVIPGLLLAGAAINGFFALRSARGAATPRGLVSLVAIAAPLAAFVISATLFSEVGEEAVRSTVFTWFDIGSTTLGFDLMADQLTCVMLLVVTGVGTLIHVYATGYMKDDPGFARFFSYLNLFTALMSILVLAGNRVVMFLGWEGVGRCSDLLIGVGWKDGAPADAGLKAFVVNRIGDAGFLLGMFLLLGYVGSLGFDAIRDYAASPDGLAALTGDSGFLGASVATVACLLLFLGATGKSAQIPLYVWLPDAMAGPTPVSALIHAATMVTAGVYLIARFSYLFALSPIAQGVVTLVAGATCLLAALMALTQFDIKKVLAYSTISQIGYMMLGVGSGNEAAGVFHLVTHAFFKASLFLGAGSVITMCHHEQDMRKMGGLRKAMPWTFAAMLVSALAMAGVPPLSGFFSKDEIIILVMLEGDWTGFLAGLMALAAAVLTGFYMFRLVLLTFGGSHRGDHPPGEAPGVMTGPVAALAVGAALIGFVGIPALLGGHDAFAHYLEPVVGAAHHGEGSTASAWGVEILTVVLSLAGIAGAWYAYVRRPDAPKAFVSRIPRFYALVRDNFRVDPFYIRTVVKPVMRFADVFCHRIVDRSIIDATVNGTARAVRGLGGIVARTQAGRVRAYVALMLIGTLVLLLTLLK